MNKEDDLYNKKKDIFDKVENIFENIKKESIEGIIVVKRLINEGNKVRWNDGVCYEITTEAFTIRATKISYYYDNENKISNPYLNTNYSIMCSDKYDYSIINNYLISINRIIDITKILSIN